MTRLLLRWVLMAFSVFAASLICHALRLGFDVKVRDGGDAVTLLVGVLVLGLLNATLGKILKLLTLPLSCLTLGLFALVVNAIVLWVAASLQLGFRITQGGLRGFLAAFVASLLIAFINGVLGVFLPDDRDD